MLRKAIEELRVKRAAPDSTTFSPTLVPPAILSHIDNNNNDSDDGDDDDILKLLNELDNESINPINNFALNSTQVQTATITKLDTNGVHGAGNASNNVTDTESIGRSGNARHGNIFRAQPPIHEPSQYDLVSSDREVQNVGSTKSAFKADPGADLELAADSSVFSLSSSLRSENESMLEKKAARLSIPFPFSTESFQPTMIAANRQHIVGRLKQAQHLDPTNFLTVEQIRAPSTMGDGEVQYKVPWCCLMVKEYGFYGHDARAVLCDETGEIEATIHQGVMKEETVILHYGLFLVLRDVTLFTLSLQHRHLIVVSKNLHAAHYNLHNSE